MYRVQDRIEAQQVARIREQGRRAARLLQHDLHTPLSDLQVFGEERMPAAGLNYDDIEAACQELGIDVPLVCAGPLPEALRRLLAERDARRMR